MSIVLLRHGATHACVNGVLRGRRDDPLTDEGWQQMRAAVAAGAESDDRWQAIVSSPLIRCAEFAHELAQARGLPLQIDERLVEMDFGAWEGRRIDELLQDPVHSEALRQFWDDPWHHPPPQGETLASFETRIHEAWSSILARPAQRPLLIVTHGGVIRLLLCAAQRRPRSQLLHLEVPNASLHRLKASPLPRLNEQ
jgi:alpha-ribazole phosphatase